MGDVIRVNNETGGQVQRLTLRVVVLRDVEAVVHTIPNGEIRQVANPPKEGSRALLHVGVASGEDVDRVIRIMAKTLPLKQWDVMREMRRRIKARFDREGIEIPFSHRTLYGGRDQPAPAWLGAAGDASGLENPGPQAEGRP